MLFLLPLRNFLEGLLFQKIVLSLAVVYYSAQGSQLLSKSATVSENACGSWSGQKCPCIHHCIRLYQKKKRMRVLERQYSMNRFTKSPIKAREREGERGGGEREKGRARDLRESPKF
jgi:hypothetical protein